MQARAHIFISGRVQGVFFRSATKHQAKLHDVKGWVRNLPDSRVEAILEGKKEAIQVVIEFCKHGPQGSAVSNVDLFWEKFTGEFTEFRIKYG